MTPRRVRQATKRAMDLAGGVVGLILLAPILTLTAVCLLVTQGRPILFRQQRPGLNGRPFRIAKFRTMRPTRAGELAHQTDDVRLTRLGGLLRTWSIDELPELWNVLRGEMSLVGPRPLLMEYLSTYSEWQRRRHLVRPGITSWAAVNGRHRLRFDERLALDIWYVDHWSLRLDARVLAMTLGQVLRRTDVTATQGVEEIGFPLEPAGPEVARLDRAGSEIADSQPDRDAEDSPTVADPADRQPSAGGEPLAAGEDVAAVDPTRWRPRRRAGGRAGSASPRRSR